MSASSTYTGSEILPSADLNVDHMFYLYKQGIEAQQKRCFKRAFRCFRPLLPFLATEPLLWVRIVEVCIYALYDECDSDTRTVAVGHPRILKCGLIRLNNGKIFLELTDFTTIYTLLRLADEGITLEFASEAVTVALALVSTSPDSGLRLSTMSLAAFVALKQGRVRYAAKLADDIIYTDGVSKDFLLRGVMYKVECYFAECRYDEALCNLMSIAECDEELLPYVNFNRCVIHCAKGEYDIALTQWMVSFIYIYIYIYIYLFI
uniref:TPR_REGION domain-containing protein n=1 Tax=Heterorhabditis bacteriophora TaxID=37862 RepID=A0A1I7XNT3_HETBA